MKRKIAVIGLDCAVPSLVFDKWIHLLPNLRNLIENGISGPLRSSDPPITIPAWSVMFSGVDAGALGVYGFRNRMDYSYENLSIADSRHIREQRLWDIFTQTGKTSIVTGVPQTYPVTPVRGVMIAGLLATDMNRESVYPQSIIGKIRSLAPDYRFDIEDFRNEDRKILIKKIYQMTRSHFKVARHMLDNTDWDSFIFVEIGPDRLQHAFWHYMDPDSVNFEADSPFKNVIQKYYQYLDFEIGTLLKRLDDNTDVFVVSDHGAKAFKGGFCINQWLIENGYLVLKNKPAQITRLTQEMIDWHKTKVWAEGGYYGRCFFNITGREKQGLVKTEDLSNLKKELKIRLSNVEKQKNGFLENKVWLPEELYVKVNGVAPDMLVYPDDLNFRAIGSVGRDKLITERNDSGPDGANHDYEGICIFKGRDIPAGQKGVFDIKDIAPTILKRMHIQVPQNMQGNIIHD